MTLGNRRGRTGQPDIPPLPAHPPRRGFPGGHRVSFRRRQGFPCRSRVRAGRRGGRIRLRHRRIRGTERVRQPCAQLPASRFLPRDRTLRKAPLGEEGEEWARTDLDFRYTSYCSLGRTVFLAGQSTGGWVYAYDTGEGVLRRLTRLPEELRESNLGSPATAAGGNTSSGRRLHPGPVP